MRPGAPRVRRLSAEFLHGTTAPAPISTVRAVCARTRAARSLHAGGKGAGTDAEKERLGAHAIAKLADGHELPKASKFLACSLKGACPKTKLTRRSPTGFQGLWFQTVQRDARAAEEGC